MLLVKHVVPFFICRASLFSAVLVIILYLHCSNLRFSHVFATIVSCLPFSREMCVVFSVSQQRNVLLAV